MEKVIERDRDPSRRKRIKSLEKRIDKMKQESARDRILLHFKLGKELSEEYIKGGNKYNKTIARRIYQSFAKMYPHMPYNKSWKLGHFKEMSVKNTEEIAHNWISTELNPIEGENIWPSQDQPMEAQQND